MSTASKPKIIVAAIASRPYVEAAVACGYAVVAIDAFVDDEVQALAEACYQLEFTNGQLNIHQLMQVMRGLDLQQFVGFCYGAGFEKEPAILSIINDWLPVIGNLEQVVARCKSPNDFFSLCDRLALPYPKVMFSWPPNPAAWLRKEIGASGGGHIKQLGNVQIADSLHGQADVYYQQFQHGKPISCLFIASNNHKQEHLIQVIGFNEQLISPCQEAPFRYGGAVSNIDLSDVAKARFEYYVSRLSQAIGLVGINSCDAICDGDDVYLLEINPRLSATMALYAKSRLFERHVASVNGRAVMINADNKTKQAYQVVYAEDEVTIKGDIIWPEWVYDRPAIGSLLEKGSPVCTVVAEAKTAEQAKSLVNERVVAMSRELLN